LTKTTGDGHGKANVKKLAYAILNFIKVVGVLMPRWEIVRLIMVPVTPAQQADGHDFSNTHESPMDQQHHIPNGSATHVC
jgi:hypothetical protein